MPQPPGDEASVKLRGFSAKSFPGPYGRLWLGGKGIDAITNELLTLQESADRIGVHYMTVYRYVRTGRLPAVRLGGTWEVQVADLEALSNAGTGAAPRGSGLSQARSRLLTRLIAGDEAGAWQLVERSLSSGTAPELALVGLIGVALEEIGAAWSTGKASVADEHRASAVATRLISRLGARFQPRGRKRGTVVLAAPPGELHGIPVSMAADVLRWNGFTVVDLGADTPPDALAETVRVAPELLAVGLACTTSQEMRSVPGAVAAVHANTPGVPVLLGGGAIVNPAHAMALGADYYTGRVATELLRKIDELAGSRTGCHLARPLPE